MVRLVTLGECAVEVGDARIGPEAEVLFALLLILGVEAGRRIPRRELMALLWPGADDRAARHCLRQALYKVRQLGVQLDATETEVCLPAARFRADYLELDPSTGALASPAAAGDVLPGYAPGLSAAYAARVERYRGVAQSHVRRALLAALAVHRKAMHWPQVEAIAQRCLQLDPLNEEATLALAESTALAGNKARALAILDQYTAEVGARDAAGEALVTLQPSLLRRRIGERIPEPRYRAPVEGEFVGRDESVAYLNALLDGARSGRGGGTLVWGDAGIGKTRLVTEFTDAALLRGTRVQRVGCQPSDVHRPLSVFVDVVPPLLNVPGALGCSPESMAYLKRLTEHDRSSTTPSEASREAEYLYGRVRRALFDLVDAIAAECTLVLVVEDVHWCDTMSWGVLREMIEWAGERRVLIVLTSRTPKAEADSPRWAGRPLDRHALRPLAERDTASLVESLLRDVPRQAVDEAVRARWVELSDGNPLFAREMVQQWLATGIGDRVPQSLLSLVDARIARLSAAALRVFQACAILRKNATIERVDLLMQYPYHQLLDAVDELERTGLVTGAAPALRVRHDLLSEAALRRLGPASAQALNRGAASILQQEIEESQSAALLWDCARHWQAGGATHRAVQLATARAKHLLELGLPLAAAEVCTQCTELCSTRDERESLLRHKCYALRIAGEWVRLRATLTELHGLRPMPEERPVHDDAELTELHAAYHTGGNLDQVIERALACAGSNSARPSHRLEAASLAFILAYQSCNEQVLHDAYRAVEGVLNTAELDAVARERAYLMYRTMSGDYSRAVAAGRTLIALERQISNPSRLAQALEQAWNAFFSAGLVDEAARALIEAYELAETARGPSVVARICSVLLEHYLQLGEADTAQLWYARAQEWSSTSDQGFHSIAVSYAGARLAILRGDISEAERRLGVSVEALRKDTAVQRRIEGIAIALRIEIERGQLPDADLVMGLERDLRKIWWTSQRDHEVLALGLALVRLGRDAEAVALSRDYLRRWRRGRSPINPELLAFCDRIERQVEIPHPGR